MSSNSNTTTIAFYNSLLLRFFPLFSPIAMVVVQGLEAKNRRGRPPKTVRSKTSVALSKVANNGPIKSECQKRKRVTMDDLYGNDEVKSEVLLRASEVKDTLAPQFPSMIKVMLPSHVTGGFWLGLRKEFCDKHMPIEDTMFVLEDENGKTSLSKYLAHKAGLSGGWRGFSIDHNLVEGDVAVFHLVEQAKFKVYIVRVNGSEEVDGALGLLKLDAAAQKMNPFAPLIMAAEEMKYEDSQPLLDEEESKKMRGTSSISDHSENGSEDLGFEISDGIRLSEECPIDFKAVKCFDDFDIIVNGLVINAELCRHLQKKYYELCLSQNGFLHDHLLHGLNCKLITGIIAETINIADAIRASKIDTSQDNFSTWEKTLVSFGGLGLNVGFLLARLRQLMSLTDKSQRCKEAKVERVNAEEEMRSLEARILEVRNTMNMLDAEIETLEVSDNDTFEHMFQEMAKAPW